MKMDSVELFESSIFTNIVSHAKSVQQSRSNFQLEKFVLGQHDTEPMQFFQLCLEILEISYNLKVAHLELAKLSIKRDRLLTSEDEIDQLDAEIISLGMDRTQSVINGTLVELNKLVELYEQFPIKYTREEIEKDQTVYWSERLSRQALLEQVSVSTAQSEHFNSLRQAGLISINKNSISWVDYSLPIENNDSD